MGIIKKHNKNALAKVAFSLIEFSIMIHYNATFPN